jgi:hypothetical protein
MMRAGDLVWWNEGVCIGHIEEIIGTQDECARWGITEPSYAVSNLHPFEACSTKHKQHIGGIFTGGTVVYPETHMEDDGLGLLDDEECKELYWAISHAKSIAGEDFAHVPFCVYALMRDDLSGEDWHFHFVDDECKSLEEVVFPLRPSTRSSFNRNSPAT